ENVQKAAPRLPPADTGWLVCWCLFSWGRRSICSCERSALTGGFGRGGNASNWASAGDTPAEPATTVTAAAKTTNAAHHVRRRDRRERAASPALTPPPGRGARTGPPRRRRREAVLPPPAGPSVRLCSSLR